MKLGIETNYTDLGKIQYLIANRNLDQLEPVYTDKVEMTVFVPTDEMGSLRAELMEGTNGADVLVKRQPVGLQGQKMELRFLMKNDSHRRCCFVR